MVYKEIHGDLFSAPKDTYFVHCISADFALGAGIAVQFVKRFNVKTKLFNQFPDGFVADYREANLNSSINTAGFCVKTDNVFNLITKERCYQKPTYASLWQSLICLKTQCEQYQVKSLAMPLIGCGLDKLLWSNVSQMVAELFCDTDIAITVYIK